jgi:hypothetical protein
MKIYTKTGDRGDTGLFGGARVSKASVRVNAYGDVDELNSVLGVVCTHTHMLARLELLHQIQSDLFTVGAELAKNPDKDVDLGMTLVAESDIARLEHAIAISSEVTKPGARIAMPGAFLCCPPPCPINSAGKSLEAPTAVQTTPVTRSPLTESSNVRSSTPLSTVSDMNCIQLILD